MLVYQIHNEFNLSVKIDDCLRTVFSCFYHEYVYVMLFDQGWQGRYQDGRRMAKLLTALYCSRNLLFGDILNATAVEVYARH